MLRVKIELEGAEKCISVTGSKTFQVKDQLREDFSMRWDPEGRRWWCRVDAGEAAGLVARLEEAMEEENVSVVVEETQAPVPGPIRRADGAARRAQLVAPYEPRIPTPSCEKHGEQCVLLTVRNGMPHNIGRQFYKCPRQGAEARGCTWVWADGTAPFSEEAQSRFRAHVGRHGFGGYREEQLGFGAHNPLALMFGGC